MKRGGDVIFFNGFVNRLTLWVQLIKTNKSIEGYSSRRFDL